MPDTETRSTMARLRYVRTSPPKMRLVLDLIRGQDVETARDTLRFCERAAAGAIGKLLDSAIANAEHNNHIPEDELFVARALADEGPTLKRWRPRARGRGVRINKRTSHVTIVLTRFSEDDLDRRRQADSAAGRAPRRAVRRRPTRTAEPAEELDEAPEATADVEAEAEAATEALAAKKTPAKKTTAKKTTAKRTPAKKTPAKKKGQAAKKQPTPRKQRKPKDER